jgi:uncharacterized coiled-coil protein SlyX
MLTLLLCLPLAFATGFLAQQSRIKRLKHQITDSETAISETNIHYRAAEKELEMVKEHYYRLMLKFSATQCQAASRNKKMAIE